MILDMYLYSKKGKHDTPVEIGFWWKHSNLHNHIENIWRNRKNTGDFNAVYCKLTEKNIYEIINKSKNDSFDSKNYKFEIFFCRSGAHQNKDTIDIMQQALQEIRSGKSIYYFPYY